MIYGLVLLALLVALLVGTVYLVNRLGEDEPESERRVELTWG